MADYVEKIKNLLEKAFSLLINNDWNGASNIAEEILDLNGQNSDAYLIKLMAELRVPSIDDFGNLDEQLSGYYFQKALVYADADSKKKLESYNTLIETKKEERRLESAYQLAFSTMINARSIQDYEKAIGLFQQCQNYKDSTFQISQCQIAIKEILYQNAVSNMNNSRNIQDYQKTIGMFQLCHDYRDSNQQIQQCYISINEIIYREADNLSKDPNHWKDAIRRFNDIRNYKDAGNRIALLEQAIIDAENKRIADQADSYFSDAQSESNLDKKLSLLQSAAQGYLKLGSYAGAKANYDKCCFQIDDTNLKIQKKKQTQRKIRLALVLSAVLALAVAALYLFYFQYIFKYNRAIRAISADSYEEAESLLTELNDFSDSRERLGAYKEDRYQRGILASQEGNYSLAIELLTPLREYKDSGIVILDCTKRNNYALGKAAIEADNYSEASQYLAGLDFSDSTEILEAYRNKRITFAEELAEGKKYTEALAILEIMSDSDKAITAYAEIQNAQKYDQLINAINKDDYPTALGLLTDLEEYENSATLFSSYRRDRIERAQTFATEKNYTEAYAILDQMSEFSETSIVKSTIQKAEKHDLLLTAIEDDDYSTALELMTVLTGYEDSDTLFSTYRNDRIERAQTLASEKKYTEAYAILDQMSEFDKSATVKSEILKADKYDQATIAIEADDYLTASSILTEISDYSDSSSVLKTYQDSRVQLARTLANEKKYVDAYKILDVMSGYEPAETVFEEIHSAENYDLAIAAIQADDYIQASSLIAVLDGFSDSQLKMAEYQQRRIDNANSLAALGDYDGALAILAVMSDCSDAQNASANITNQKLYASAILYEEGSDYISAYQIFKGLGSFSDSVDHLVSIEPKIKKMAADAAENKDISLIADLVSCIGIEKLSDEIISLDDESMALLYKMLPIEESVKMVDKTNSANLIPILNELDHSTLSGIFETLLPRRSAEILQQFDASSAADILNYMQKSNAAKILNNMWRTNAVSILNYFKDDDLFKVLISTDTYLTGMFINQAGKDKGFAVLSLFNQQIKGTILKDVNLNIVVDYLWTQDESIRDELLSVIGKNDLAYIYSSPIAKTDKGYTYSVISLGNYYQDNTDYKRPIEWMILNNEKGVLDLISHYAIDCQPYNKEKEKISWEDSFIRNWLNTIFWKSAFSDEEKELIEKVTNSTKGSANTQDHVYLLSVDEANKFFPQDSMREAKPTKYAKSQGAGTGFLSSYTKWWLRTQGSLAYKAAAVHPSGDIDYSGEDVNQTNRGVRPAIKYNALAALNLSSSFNDETRELSYQTLRDSIESDDYKLVSGKMKNILSGYKDSDDIIRTYQYDRYQRAVRAAENGNYDEAIAILEDMFDYEDSEAKYNLYLDRK